MPLRSQVSARRGLEFQLEDKAGIGIEKWPKFHGHSQLEASQRKELSAAFTPFRNDIPQYEATVNKEKAKTMGIPVKTHYNRSLAASM